MSSACFVSQVASEDILKKVTSFCAECYSELKVGDTIHYDMKEYRYLCDCCHQRLCTMINEECEIVRKEDPGLFC
jgi:hypothetical protein